MIKSMTGFARSEANSPCGQLLWELRSVNHRYLEAQLRLPEGFRGLEADARQAIGQGVRRGKVDATLTLRQAGAGGHRMTLNRELAGEIIAHAEQVAALMQEPASLSPAAVLNWPGVLQQETAQYDEALPVALQALDAAVAELAASRAREGARIAELLETRCAEIDARVASLQARLPAVLGEIRAKLAERVKSLGATVNPERLEQEVALLAQKLDVAEELDRLRAHVAEFRDTLGAEEPAGRRLDFLLQEFNREANTLASKSADTATTRDAVDLKVLIEQMREQVQNVE